MANTTRNPLRPADVEQVRLALVLHRSGCAVCQAGQKCDTARNLGKALAR